MHLARPTIMTPARYPGKSGRVAQASPVISNGPINQFKTSEVTICCHTPFSESRLQSSSYCTLHSTGHIMSHRPMAMGRLTVSTCTTFKIVPMSVNYPKITPRIMAPMIQKGSSLSSKLRLIRTPAHCRHTQTQCTETGMYFRAPCQVSLQSHTAALVLSQCCMGHVLAHSPADLGCHTCSDAASCL